jgi:transketolase
VADSASATATPDTSLDTLAINTVRVLAMDAVQKANSGHPGTPMALAPIAYVLYTRHMRHDPHDPGWPNRDRFVLSCGHASMLLYATLHLSGYDLTLEDLKQFRQWESKTPGHPEYGYTPGVETTTGPLGQGMGNAVGMALAEKHLSAVFNRPGHDIVDHYTYFICSDGDLMEGISHEAASFAGHFGLGKLIGFYDDNKITIDGSTDLTYTDDVAERFEAYGWHVQRVENVNDLERLDEAIARAKAETGRASLIICRTHIGYGSPKQDSEKAHGEPLGPDAIKAAKEFYGYPSLEPFFVPPEALDHWRECVARGAAEHDAWRKQLIAYTKAFPSEAKELGRRLHGDLPAGWEQALPSFTKENGSIASRAASGAVLAALIPKIPDLFGGSADLTPSNNTMVKGEQSFSPENPEGRYLHYGIREHGMAAIMNGLSLHGGMLPYGGTFLIFSDYMRPSQRLAAFMNRQVIYVFTHDSIGLGEDGPTHQPVEQLAALRAIPEFTVIRPADASETVEAWRAALRHREGPTALVLSRQKLGFIDREKYAPASGVLRGAYVLADAKDGRPEVVLMSSGSEVALILEAKEKLDALGIAARAVSMPSMEIFARQPEDYRRSVLPDGPKRIAIEAAHPMPWHRWVGGDGLVIGIDRFGASAPFADVYKGLGITVDRLVEAGRELAKKR